MNIAKICRLALLFTVENEINIALLIMDHILGSVFANSNETKSFKQRRQFVRIIAGIFNEFEPISPERVFK